MATEERLGAVSTESNPGAGTCQVDVDTVWLSPPVALTVSG